MCHVESIEEIYPGPVVRIPRPREHSAHWQLVHMNVRVFIAS